MTTGAKMRVYEIAKELKVPNKELIAKIRALGLEVNNHMSSLDADEVTRLKRSLERERLASTETQRLSSTVLRRRSKGDQPVRRRAGAGAEADAGTPAVRSEAPAASSRPPASSPSAQPAMQRAEATPQAAAEPKRAPALASVPASGPGTSVVDRRETDIAPQKAQVPATAESRKPETSADTARAVEPSRAQEAAPRPAPAASTEQAPAAPPEAKVEAKVEAKPEAKPEPKPEPKVEAKPEPKVEAKPEPKIEAKPEPKIEAKPAASSAPAAVSAQPSAAAEQASKRPRTPVVIQGPPTVAKPGSKPAQQPKAAAQPAREEKKPAEVAQKQEVAAPAERTAADDKRRQARPATADRSEPAKKPEPATVQDVADTARSRFEQELARARRRVTEREVDERSKREAEAAKVDKDRDPARPAVGSVISLPTAKIKITERTPTAPRRTPGQGPLRDRFANNRGRNPRQKRDFGRKRLQGRKTGKSTQITTPAEHKRVIRMEDTVAIPELAKFMGVKANEVLKKLWSMGMVGVNINASIDYETAQLLASEFGYEVQNVAFKEEEVFVREADEETELQPRAPVVTVMGHVDHGKTSLLDAIRKSKVASGEAGGITQHIAAYKVTSDEAYGDIVFLDTPGHEAFTAMRARGAQCTDIAVLVVAANDGVMPQTQEALNHAKDANVAIIVAVNKCDMPDAQPERVRQQLAEYSLIPEEWGGETLYVDVSAHTGEGIDNLLEAITLTAELLDLKANPDKSSMGVVIEAKLDRNRGPMATVLLQEGTLRTGDVVVAGCYYGKVRAMLDDKGKPIKDVGPSTPIELLGLDGVPTAGETLNVADDEKIAKQVVEYRRQQQRKKELASTGRVSIENLMERIQEGESHELKIVLKADVQGSSEALKASLIKQSTDKVKVNVIQAGVGGITETDVNLAKAGNAIIVGFHVRPAGKSAKLAEQEGVEIRLYDVIYEAMEDVRRAMAGMLAPIRREHEVGTLEVRDTFTIPKVGTVAGCMVTSGRVLRKSLLRVIRDSVQIYEGRVGSLRRFKEDTAEVKEGYECGVMVQGFNDLRVGDVIESYEIVESAAEL